jgi:uncharacterized protein YpiB (UPF0302 family)
LLDNSKIKQSYKDKCFIINTITKNNKLKHAKAFKFFIKYIELSDFIEISIYFNKINKSKKYNININFFLKKILKEILNINNFDDYIKLNSEFTNNLKKLTEQLMIRSSYKLHTKKILKSMYLELFEYFR